MINHTQIAHVCVVNTHAGARFDRRLDDFAQLVHNVTRPVENITARIVRVILANDERFGGLIIGSRAVLNRRWDDRSRYRYCFCGGLCTFRTRLCKCQQRNQRAGNSNNCFLYHNASYVQPTQAPTLCSINTRSTLCLWHGPVSPPLRSLLTLNRQPNKRLAACPARPYMRIR